MSCPKSHRDKQSPPKLTKAMKDNGLEYIWRMVESNPNLYCWIPKTKQNNMDTLSIDDIDLHDIPPPVINPNFGDVITQIADDTEKLLLKTALSERKNDPHDLMKLVSADDPEKYKIVKQFIQDKGLILYGGAAINAQLPREAKIYNQNDIPDYDFWSTQSWDDAVELANIFYQRGYKFIEVKSGVHPGTYKVFVEMWPVADITFMEQDDFDAIPYDMIGGVRIASSLKLLQALYKEASTPFSNPSRWPKISSREKLLMDYKNPLKKKVKCDKMLFRGDEIELPEKIVRIIQHTIRFATKKSLIFTGPFAYNKYMEAGKASARVVVDRIKLFGPDVQLFFQLIDELMLVDRTINIITKYMPSHESDPMHRQIFVEIDGREHLIVEYMDEITCIPYQFMGKKKIASIDMIKYLLYTDAVFDSANRNNYICLLQMLEHVQTRYYQKNNIDELDKSPFQRYIGKCDGPSLNNLKVSLLDRWIDRELSDKQKVKYKTKKWSVVKTPRSPIKPECRNQPRSSCKNPTCTWNTEHNICTDIPAGIYRPGQHGQLQEYEE